MSKDDWKPWWGNMGSQGGSQNPWGGGHHDGGDNCPLTVCFRSGTRILTATGEVAVEDLRPGDLILDHEGRQRPVKWIGSRRINLAAHPAPENAAPIRFARGALTDTVPHRDLYVSPDHALYLNGVLIPASKLVNGSTITQVPLAEVVYHHVELETHGVLYAEGAAAESFLNLDDARAFFSNAPEVVQLHPGFSADAPRLPPARGGFAARARLWLLARTAALGHRLHNVASRIGARRIARLAAQLNYKAMHRLLGAVAPRATFGPAVEEARRQAASRATETAQTATDQASRLSA